MHEVAIVEDMFRIIMEVAKKEQLSRIDRVHFRVGKMMQMVPELFRFAFDSVKEDTIAENADLEIEYVPVKMSCRYCGHEFFVEDQSFYCPKCESSDLDLIQGKELLVQSIEGE
ncbi:MAG: hydrogenase maturation nickel metallochaperone HypA [Bacteroidota bacterium]